jgi:hypothetical protein
VTPPSENPSSENPTEPDLGEVETQTAPRVKRLPSLRARPSTGLLAWQSTVGYISQNKHPDAQLRIEVIPQDRVLGWSAALAWGWHREEVSNRTTMAAALHDLWMVVSQYVVIFDQKADEVLAPVYYDQADWLDIPTQEILQRLLWMTMTVFRARWRLVMIYQPVEMTQRRFQMRLLVRSDGTMPEDEPTHYDIIVGARGATLIDACRTLYRNAAPHFLVHTTQTKTSLEDTQGNEPLSDQ